MKNRTFTGLIVAGLLVSGASFSLLAQNGTGQGHNGRGYGGPPKSEAERAARQAACLEKNGGVCPAGGPRTDCPGGGMGQGRGNGNGNGHRYGLRNGTGPRSMNGTCPLNAPKQGSK